LLAATAAAYKTAEDAMRQPPKKNKKAVLIGIGIVALSALLAFWSCDKDLRDGCYWLASAGTPANATQYSSNWPVSESDFAAAQDLVTEELHYFEHITQVTVPGPDDIRINTTGPDSSTHQFFFLRRIDGEWRIEDRRRVLDAV